jgi:hypothetical protein
MKMLNRSLLGVAFVIPIVSISLGQDAPKGPMTKVVVGPSEEPQVPRPNGNPYWLWMTVKPEAKARIIVETTSEVQGKSPEKWQLTFDILPGGKLQMTSPGKDGHAVVQLSGNSLDIDSPQAKIQVRDRPTHREEPSDQLPARIRDLEQELGRTRKELDALKKK